MKDLTSAKIVADSINEGDRITTLEVVFPRFVLAEFNTHRMLSRNSASSRAIPVIKQLRKVLDEPFVPQEFGTNQRGMQAAEPLTGADHDDAVMYWLTARDNAVMGVIRLLTGIGYSYSADEVRQVLDMYGEDAFKETPGHWPNVHKQIANRLLEPFMWHTAVVTATEWDNFFHLRCHPDAQPEIRRAAEGMRKAIDLSKPVEREIGDWHLPYLDDREREELGTTDKMVRVSAARCARVSYLTQDGKRDFEADFELHDRLVGSGHMSPTEHPATPSDLPRQPSGNFRGWDQYRKMLPNEQDALGNL
jgi:hypothetical protein